MVSYIFSVILGFVAGLVAARNPVVQSAVDAGITEIKSWFE